MSKTYRFLNAGLRLLSALLLQACSTAALAETSIADRVAQVFSPFAHEDSPGCAVGVAQDGKTVHESAYGMADVAAHRPLRADSIFNIASVSKQFTAFSILLLEQRHALNLDDPVVKYVPELRLSAPNVTVRQLLHHTGGLREYISLLRLRGRRNTDGATQFETIALLGHQKSVNSSPGAEFEYSNSGYAVLATIVERVSGRTFREFLQENIFAPLGMRHTSDVDRYPPTIANLARGYIAGERGFEADESAWEQIGDGQIHTTLADLALWAENFDAATVGGPALIRQMLERGVLNSGERISYASGVLIGEYRGLPIIRHSGAWAGYGSELLLFPSKHLSIAVLCNRNGAHPDRSAKAVAEIFLGEKLPPPSVPGEDLRTLTSAPGITELRGMPAGAYRNELTNEYLHVIPGPGVPQLLSGSQPLGIEPLQKNLMRVPDWGDALAAFARPAGAPARVILMTQHRPTTYNFVPDWKPASLTPYAGTYSNEELGARCNLLIKGSSLVLESCAEGVTLQPGTRGDLIASDDSVSLRFPADGSQTSFLLFMSGVRGVRFERIP